MEYNEFVNLLVSNPYVLLGALALTALSAYSSVKALFVYTAKTIKLIFKLGPYAFYRRTRKEIIRNAFSLIKQRGLLIQFRLWMITRIARWGFSTVISLQILSLVMNFGNESDLTFIVAMSLTLASGLFITRFALEFVKLHRTVELARIIHDRFVERGRQAEVKLND